MSTYSLSNEELLITINSHGAELTCLKDVKNGKNYLWDARPEYWARYSPVLFPLVGSLKGKSYSFEGIKYNMNQHGFARDKEFELVGQTTDTIWFVLKSTEETMAVYPFEFSLQVGYQLIGRSVKVMWKVINEGQKNMYFSIGAHPAFVCPIVPHTKREDYYLHFEGADRLNYRLLTKDGLAQRHLNSLETKSGIIPFEKELFRQDALVFENHQTQAVSLLTPEKVPYITVKFDAPLFGVWTPTRGDAPFICIEPWYGRCDGEDFDGTLKEREWSNTLGSKEVFDAAYSIEVHTLQ
ncbi:MAG: aldose 1-epimerase family protein [bacterium]|nr:aldose 1-epimerase family protein [bacterium]